MRSIVLPDGARLIGRGRVEPLPEEHVDRALALGRLRRGEQVGSWPTTWVAWRDFGLPADRDETARLVVEHGDLARSGEVLEVCCRGGVGRTGTVLAALVTRTGMSADDAIAWVRSRYHPHAVETAAQRRWVAWFADQSH